MKTFADFEQGMLKVKAISGATDAEFKALTESAKLLGSSTMFTAAQVAELQLNLSKLGLTPTQINQSTESILNLAQATDSDLAQAATVTAKIMNAFGMEATEMQRITDVMADSFSSTALDMTKFETAMASVAPVAKMAGADIEKTSAILGVLVNNGVEASTAGTALRNIFLDLSKSGKTWDQAMNEINSSTKPLAVAMDMFGKRGANVATILAQSGVEIQNLTSDFRDSTGEAKAMAEIMDSGVAGSLRKMRSQLEGAAIQLGETLVPVFQAVINRISKLVTWFSNLSTETQKSIVKWALFIATLGPFLIFVGKISVGLSSLIKGFLTLRTAVLAASTSFKFFRRSMIRMTAAGWAANGMIGAMTGAFRVLKVAIMTNPIGILIGALALAAGAFLTYTSATIGATVANDKFEGSTESATEKIERLSQLISNAGKDQFDIGIQETVDEIARLEEEIKGIEETLSDESARPRDALGLDLLYDQLEASKISLEDFENLLKKLKKAQKTSTEVVIEAVNVNGELTESTEKYSKSLDPLIGKMKEFAEMSKKMWHDDGILAGPMTAAEANYEKLFTMQDAWNDSVSSFGDIFSNSMQTAMTSQEDFFSSFIKNLEQAIVKQLAMLAAIEITGFLLGGIGGGMLTKGLPVGAGNFLRGIIPMADGGVVMGPQLSLIGEAGPEAVIPLDQLKNFGGAQQVEVVGKISGTDIFLSNRNTGTNRQRSV